MCSRRSRPTRTCCWSGTWTSSPASGREAVGVQALNEKLQLALNPPGTLPERRLAGRLFRVGDKVMQTRNNYDLEVFNGDVGRVQSIDFIEQKLVVNVDGRLVEYDWADADELVHAFPASVHRLPGSDAPAPTAPLSPTAHLL